MSKKGRGGNAGNKYRMSLGLPMSAVINCADNSGAKNLFIVAVTCKGARLNRLPAASPGDMFMGSVKKGKPELPQVDISLQNTNDEIKIAFVKWRDHLVDVPWKELKRIVNALSMFNGLLSRTQ